MITHRLDTASRGDLEEALRTLTAWIRDSDNFTDVISRWVRTPAEYRLLDQGRVQLSTLDHSYATALGMDPSAWVRRRNSVLQLTARGRTLVLAEVASTIAKQRLPKSAGDALDEGILPLGAILKPLGVRRHTHSVERIDELDGSGRTRMLRVRATLTLVGVVVAEVDETVHQALIDHRLPGRPARVHVSTA